MRIRGAVPLLVVLALGLAACTLPFASEDSLVTPTLAEPSPEAQAEATELPPGTTALIFWEPFPLDRPQGLLLGEMVHEFEGLNPDIVVDVVPRSGYEGIHEGLMAELPGGELPDLAVAFPSMIAQYAEFGVVVPLDTFIADPELGLAAEDLADFYPGLLKAGELAAYGGRLMAFPFIQNAIGMWVNWSALSQAGWKSAPATWDEFEQACLDVWAYTGLRCYPYVESVTTLSAWIYSRGGQILDLSVPHAAFNGPAGVESLALLRRLIDTGLAWRPEGPYGDYVAFANGEAAFSFSSTGNRSLYRNAYDGALQRGRPAFEWSQTLIPQTDPAMPATALTGTSFFILRRDPARERAAWKFIRWFTQREQAARWAGEVETMPVRASALQIMTDTLNSEPLLRLQVEEILPYALPEPAIAGELQVREVLYTAILSVTLGYADPQTALDEAARDVNAILAEEP